MTKEETRRANLGFNGAKKDDEAFNKRWIAFVKKHGLPPLKFLEERAA